MKCKTYYGVGIWILSRTFCLVSFFVWFSWCKVFPKLSSNRATFESAAPIYEEALRRSHFNPKLECIPDSDKQTKTTPSQKRHRRNIIWFSLPFSKNVKTNFGHNFLKLIEKHFPKSHNLHKIFNRNTTKISYSCMKSAITKHNSQVLNRHKKLPEKESYNCRKKEDCPLQGNCLADNIIYREKNNTLDCWRTVLNNDTEDTRNLLKT